MSAFPNVMGEQRGDGFSAEELFGKRRSTCHAYTYDDIIIMPGMVRNSAGNVSLESRISKKVVLLMFRSVASSAAFEQFFHEQFGSLAVGDTIYNRRIEKRYFA